LATKNSILYAIKMVNKKKATENQKVWSLFQDEIKILQLIKNDNVVQFIDYFEDDINAYLVLEYCDE